MDMNSSITIKEISSKECDKLKSDFKLNVFSEPFWVDAFKNDAISPIYFEFLWDKQTVGLAGGIVVQSRYKFLQSISKSIYLFGMPKIQDDLFLIAIDEFKRYLKKKGFNVIDFAHYYNEEDHCLEKLGFVTKQSIEYIIDLSPPLPEIWRNLSRGQRRVIDKVKKSEELLFNASYQTDRLEDLIACLNETRDRKSDKGFGDYEYYYIPFLNTEVLARLLKTENASIRYVTYNNRTVSACLVVKNSHYGYCVVGGSTKEGTQLGAFTYMMWKIIEGTKEAGCEALNLAGLPKDESSAKLQQYKLSLGAKARLCQGANSYLCGRSRKFLHRCYKFVLQPNVYLKDFMKLINLNRTPKNNIKEGN